MTPTELKYVEKLKELIDFLLDRLEINLTERITHKCKEVTDDWQIKYKKLFSEISVLENEMEKELKQQIDNYSFSSDPHDD